VLADICLDGRAFVLLSQIINDCEKPEAPLSVGSRGKALVLGLENLALSGVEASESGALKSELESWGELSRDPSRQELLRYRASLLRVRRLAENFEAQVISIFCERSEKLGRLLGVPESAVKIFSEAEIRSHLIFQISKIADALLNQTRTDLGLAPWETVVTGTARGTVVLLAGLTQNPNPISGPIIAVVQKAEGDEEIPPDVAGIALAHEIPHLAHLSVRARQAGVVFVTCEQPNEFERLAKLQGQSLSLTATVEGASWEIQNTPTTLGRKAASPVAKPGRVRLENSRKWLSLEEADNETAGAKATGAHRLAELASKNSAAFSTPRGLVIPFGVMEKALAGAPQVARAYSELARQADSLDPSCRASVLRRLSDLVRQLEVPEEVRGQLQQCFANDQPLVVRSSANCEDLEQFAGAGLYESVINVLPAQIESAVRAVWASLWTERATASRLAAGIPHSEAHMAVLIQELVRPDFSFVLHTVNPLSHRSNELYGEIVVGLGETLVGAAHPGSPYRLCCDKTSDTVEILAFGNFSQACRPDPHGGVLRETLDYSLVALSRRPSEVEELGRRLARVGALVEHAFGAPQDIEGAVAKDQIFLVQSRTQQGLSTAATA
jgi:phosphoglucan,water dikinase